MEDMSVHIDINRTGNNLNNPGAQPRPKPRSSTLDETQSSHIFLGHFFRRGELLDQALTHKSFVNESKGEHVNHNEVLEFMGDSVLGLVITHLLIEKFPTDDEGRLSKKRASLINEKTLSEMARNLGLELRLRLGKGERASGVMKNPRILASTFEAIIGAIYLDSGFQDISQILRSLFNPLIEARDWAEDFELDYKTRLQELVQEKYSEIPAYSLQEEVGPEHNKRFEVEVRVSGRVLGLGWGTSKKLAEQTAAKMALERL
jgi:ribonuclease III